MAAKRRGRRRSQTLGIALIVLVFTVVMAVQIYRVKQKNADYAAREQELRMEYEEQTRRSTELDELEQYMNSPEYVEDVAESKLGLTYENQIVFKEKKDD